MPPRLNRETAFPRQYGVVVCMYLVKNKKMPEGLDSSERFDTGS